MVFFNCGTCGQGLKKNQIDKHLQKCVSSYFSCIDCGNDFKNNEYLLHNKCISEAKKYESKDYVEKATKGELKQTAWIQKVKNAINNSNTSLNSKLLLTKLENYPNVPRKKAKFINFVKNSFRTFVINNEIIEETWKVIDSFEKTALSETKNIENIKDKNNKRYFDETSDTLSNEKKLKLEYESTKSEQPHELYSTKIEKFKWFDTIKYYLMKQSNFELDYFTLKKKVLKKYKNHLEILKNQNIGDHQFNEKLIKKIEKYTSYFSMIKGNNEEIIKIKYIHV